MIVKIDDMEPVARKKSRRTRIKIKRSVQDRKKHYTVTPHKPWKEIARRGSDKRNKPDHRRPELLSEEPL
jgi:hypothetical protein